MAGYGSGWGESVSQRASKKHYIKATYYVDPALVKRLKILGVEEDWDLSDLINEQRSATC
jgi:hypothetical protein